MITHDIIDDDMQAVVITLAAGDDGTLGVIGDLIGGSMREA
jgi:hypothetical protein